jgi:hypothetical protein
MDVVPEAGTTDYTDYRINNSMENPEGATCECSICVIGLIGG